MASPRDRISVDGACDDDARVEFNELALAELGVSLTSWRAMAA
jgi:hypothetical protein